jgi:hypothetical protein
MELIDGESLVEWLRAEQRSEAAIIDAFVEAGRGLAAAHAAGIVHRDFKPHNVLRRRNGHIAVTDFGLAREASDPLAVTMPLNAPPASAAPSKLSGLTEPGSLLGTPAYMAPEQWLGGKVTPATDQFAFCVALWEALAGERPFRGQTREALFEEVSRGPATLDATKLPRRLRPVLVRGLDPDPAKRWPSMDALLARLTGGERRWRLAITVFVAATFAATLAVLVVGGNDPNPDEERDQHVFKAMQARAQYRFDEALAGYEAALAISPDKDYIAYDRLELLVNRKHPGDLERARRELAPWRAKSGEYRLRFELLDVTAAWWQGDIAGAHARALDLHRQAPEALVGRPVSGVVVDAGGKPVAGATVVTGYFLVGDSVGVAVPLHDRLNLQRQFDLVTTDDQGRFTFQHAPAAEGAIVAQRGSERSISVYPVPGVRLELLPTTQISGRVELGGRIGGFTATVMSSRPGANTAFVSAPVLGDGSFTIQGVMPGPVMLSVGEVDGEMPLAGFYVQKPLEVAGAPIKDLALELPATRPISALVRGAGPGLTFVFAVSGSIEVTTLDNFELITKQPQLGSQIAREVHRDPPPEVASQFRRGDLAAHIKRAPIGTATVCALTIDTMAARRFRCQPLAEHAELVVIEIPPN